MIYLSHFNHCTVSTECIHHILFTQSSISCLGCCHFFLINNAAMCTYTYISARLFCIMQEVKTAELKGMHIWTFEYILLYCLPEIHLKCIRVGFPWWRSGWESACQCRGRGFEPWSERIPHATERLGPWATIAEPARLEPVLRNKRGRNSERPAHRDEEWPPLAATGESPRTETKTQLSHK